MDEAELGYRLRQDAWGKGYATEVAAALLDKAFSELDVRVVWGATMALNLASQKVMEKVGMTFTETLPTPDYMLGVEHAELGGPRYEITKEQWTALQSRGQARQPVAVSPGPARCLPACPGRRRLIAPDRRGAAPSRRRRRSACRA